MVIKVKVRVWVFVSNQKYVVNSVFVEGLKVFLVLVVWELLTLVNVIGRMLNGYLLLRVIRYCFCMIYYGQNFLMLMFVLSQDVIC